MTLRKFFLIILLLFSVTLYAETDSDLVGKRIPNFTLPILNNSEKSFSSTSLCGHVALINIWASWCYACKYEHAVLMNVKKTVPIYGINYEDKPDHAIAWLTRAGNPYVLNGMDADGNVADTLQSYGLPETYLIDANGIIRYSFRGALTEETWQRILKPVVDEYLLKAQQTKITCRKSSY